MLEFIFLVLVGISQAQDEPCTVTRGGNGTYTRIVDTENGKESWGCIQHPGVNIPLADSFLEGTLNLAKTLTGQSDQKLSAYARFIHPGDGALSDARKTPGTFVLSCENKKNGSEKKYFIVKGFPSKAICIPVKEDSYRGDLVFSSLGFSSQGGGGTSEPAGGTR